jgi:hypothetical protein
VDSRGEGRGGEGGRGGEDGSASARMPMSARMLGCVRADAPCPRGRSPASARTQFLPCPRVKSHPRVNADAGGRLDDVRGHPDEKDIQTDIFIQKRPL